MHRVARYALLTVAALLLPACGEDGPNEPEPILVFECATGHRYTIGSAVSGSLTTADCLDPGDNAAADYYEITLASAGPVSITVESPAGRLILALFDEFEDIIDFALVLPGASAVIGGNLPAGRYTLIIAAFDPGHTGSYSLASSATLPPSPPAPPAFYGCTTSQSYTIGASADGSLSQSDCVTRDGRFLDRYDFTLTVAQTVTIDLGSPEDAYLYLFNAAGTIIAEDDDGGGGGEFDSQIVITLQPGTYSIGASFYAALVTGEYILTSH